MGVSFRKSEDGRWWKIVEDGRVSQAVFVDQAAAERAWRDRKRDRKRDDEEVARR